MDISDSLDVTHEWTTPIGKIDINLPDMMRKVLLSIVMRCGDVYEAGHKLIPEKPCINLFDYANSPWNEQEVKHLQEFEKIISKIIRTYVKKAWGIAEDSLMTTRCWGNIQDTFDMRTIPHYHQRRYGWDGALLHYLTVGDEFKFSDSPDTYNPTDYSGDLLLLDPRGSIKAPNDNKQIIIKPQIGTTIVHPAYLWHETHAHTKQGIRCAMIINFSIINEQHDMVLTKLI
tara:strand:- start:1343 stop:2032 length:690 start_codon:yes stop_codon:yes gene_type:complete